MRGAAERRAGRTRKGLWRWRMGPWVSPVAGGDFSPLTAPWQGGEAEDGDPAPPSISRMASGSTKLGSRDLRKEICLHGILRGYFLFPSSSPSSCPKFIFGQVGGSLRPEVGNQGTAGEAEGWWQGPATCCHPRAPSPAWLLELVFCGTVPVSPSRAARQNASRPCAVGRARCCPCLAMLGQATRSLPAWLQRAGVNICTVPRSLYVGACGISIGVCVGVCGCARV